MSVVDLLPCFIYERTVGQIVKLMCMVASFPMYFQHPEAY